MIIFLEATNMIIKRLEIKNLHGIYNYNVSFNDDLTFIFGENGCGKTTILDIVSSIVTGRLYNLFSYDFDEIVLSYRKATKRSKLEKIRIRALDDAYEVSLNNSEIQEVIEDIRRPDEISDDITVMYLGQMVEKAGSAEIFAHQYHPYTKALISAIPLPKYNAPDNQIILKGEITSPINVTKSCRFAPRCVYAKPECFENEPQLEEIEKDHFVKCHFVREINGL